MSLARRLVLATILLAGCGGQPHPTERTATHVTPARTPTRAAAPLVPRGSGSLAAMAGPRGLTLRDRPRGRVVAHLRPRTAWGSPTVVWAVEQRGPWLGVVASALGNNRLGWLDVRRDHPRLWRNRLSLHAFLSKRVLELRRGSRLIRRIPVTVGAPDTPTPTGRFTVTDKLIPDRSISFYGCCLLALSGHQPHLRPGWAGGDRIAIHGGGGLGTAASAGCLHASDADLRLLMRLVPLGTPVVISA